MPPVPSRTATVRAFIVLATVAVLWYALDQATKNIVVNSMSEGERIPVLGTVVEFVFVRNPGAAFSFAAGATWIFSILASVVVVVIVVFARRIRSVRWAIVFGLLLGGVLGNLTDRLVREPSFGLGHVIDFISTPWIVPAVYNVADVGIVTAMVLFILLTLLGVGLDGKRSRRDDEQPDADQSEASDGNRRQAEA